MILIKYQQNLMICLKNINNMKIITTREEWLSMIFNEVCKIDNCTYLRRIHNGWIMTIESYSDKQDVIISSMVFIPE